MLTEVSERESYSDDVPVADAVEQSRSAAESADLESVDIAERVPLDDGTTPLESNEADWQEQHQIVEDPDEGDIR